jgi:hypothetical protein
MPRSTGTLRIHFECGITSKLFIIFKKIEPMTLMTQEASTAVARHACRYGHKSGGTPLLLLEYVPAWTLILPAHAHQLFLPFAVDHVGNPEENLASANCRRREHFVTQFILGENLERLGSRFQHKRFP